MINIANMWFYHKQILVETSGQQDLDQRFTKMVTKNIFYDSIIIDNEREATRNLP